MLLNVLFSTTATPEEKKKRLNDEFDIAMTAEFESEVRDMCNLSKALVERVRDYSVFSHPSAEQRGADGETKGGQWGWS